MLQLQTVSRRAHDMHQAILTHFDIYQIYAVISDIPLGLGDRPGYSFTAPSHGHTSHACPHTFHGRHKDDKGTHNFKRFKKVVVARPAGQAGRAAAAAAPERQALLRMIVEDNNAGGAAEAKLRCVCCTAAWGGR